MLKRTRKVGGASRSAVYVSCAALWLGVTAEIVSKAAWADFPCLAGGGAGKGVEAAGGTSSVYSGSERGPQDTVEPETHFRLFMENECNEVICAAIRYKNLAGEWVTDSWIALVPGRYYMVETRNRIYYFYAEGIDGGIWSRDDRQYNIGGKTYGFEENDIDDDGFGNTTIAFTCEE